MKTRRLMALSASLAGLALGANNNGFETVRIPTAVNPKCINSTTDRVTLSVYRVTVQKTSGFFTSDKKAGVAVIATLNANSIQLGQAGTQPSNVSATTPSVNLLDIGGESNGQVFLPLEYPIANRFLLSQSDPQTKTETTNMLVQMYLEKTRGANTFGTIVQDAGTILNALPIPASPYLTAANAFINFANTSIQDDAKNSGAMLFAQVLIQFADQDYPDVQTCKNNGGDSTGAIAVVAATGRSDGNLLTLGNLDQRYCWRFITNSAYEIQYAAKPAAGCSNIAESQWNEPSNDYTMMLLTATKTPSTPGAGHLFEILEAAEPVDTGRAAAWADDLVNSRKLCDSLKLNRHLCGVK